MIVNDLSLGSQGTHDDKRHSLGFGSSGHYCSKESLGFIIVHINWGFLGTSCASLGPSVVVFFYSHHSSIKSFNFTLFAFCFWGPWKHHENPQIWRGVFSFKGMYKCTWLLGPTKLSVGLGAKCTCRVALTATACTLTSPLITNDKLNCWFDFFLILYFLYLDGSEPYKVRLDIYLGVPDKTMFMQPLLGPGC